MSAHSTGPKSELKREFEETCKEIREYQRELATGCLCQNALLTIRHLASFSVQIDGAHAIHFVLQNLWVDSWDSLL